MCACDVPDDESALRHVCGKATAVQVSSALTSGYRTVSESTDDFVHEKLPGIVGMEVVASSIPYTSRFPAYCDRLFVLPWSGTVAQRFYSYEGRGAHKVRSRKGRAG